MVKIDDTRAKAAFVTLSQLSQIRHSEEIEITRAYIESVFWFMALGVSVIPILIISAFLINHTFRRLEQAHEQAVSLSKNYSELFDRNPVPLITSNTDGKILEVNNQATALTGYTHDELLKMSIDDLVSHQHRKHHPKQRAHFVHGERADRGMKGAAILQLLNADNVEVPVEVYLAKMSAGNDEFILSGLSDLTDRLQLEEKLRKSQKMKSLGQLVGGIAHDFNNILSVILGKIELLEDDIDANSPLQDFIGSAKKGSMRGAEITRKLLNSSLESFNKSQLINVNKHIQEFFPILSGSVVSSIQLKMKLGEDVCKVDVSAGDLSDALLNLIINSKDAMPAGGPITITTQNVSWSETSDIKFPDDSESHYVRIDIADTGIGIDTDDQQRVFEPFFTTKPFGEGSGLGLSMVYGFAERSGGFINIESEVGVGTTVSLFLPCTAEEENESGQSQGRAVRTLFRQESYRLFGEERPLALVVDDEEAILNISAFRLKEFGFNVLKAEDSAQALTLIEKHPELELLFTDIVMPGESDGRVLAQKACKIIPNLKVLFTSGHFQADASQFRGNKSFLHAGDTDWPLIKKPYKKAQLENAIVELFSDEG